MKVKEIECNSWWLRDSIAAITLYPCIFYNMGHDWCKENLLAIQIHEQVHVDQVRVKMDKYYKYLRWMGWIEFYAEYSWINRPHWLGGLKIWRDGRGKYEREAYETQHQYEQEHAH